MSKINPDFRRTYKWGLFLWHESVCVCVCVCVCMCVCVRAILFTCFQLTENILEYLKMNKYQHINCFKKELKNKHMMLPADTAQTCERNFDIDTFYTLPYIDIS
jgi:hypothetical protein